MWMSAFAHSLGEIAWLDVMASWQDRGWLAVPRRLNVSQQHMMLHFQQQSVCPRDNNIGKEEC
eukprot:1160274-Pelagomonas_calceolata.AAC.5